MGFDFGWGGAINFDGNWVHIDTSDVWWGGSDFNNGDVWHVEVEAYGYNVMEIWGSEGCCDGAHDIRYNVNGGDWSSINDWSEWGTNCCCEEGSDAGNCSCVGEDLDGSMCECEGYPYCPDVTYDECDEVTFYSECYGWGDSFEVNGSSDCLEWEPKSMCIPIHKTVTLYNMCDF